MSAEREISVILPVFNGERFICEALDSVLCQTRPADQIIVVDDGSTDATPEQLERYRSRGVTVCRQENQGSGAARNRGVTLAKGMTLAFLDADDVWLPTALESAERALLADDSLDIVFGHVEQFSEPEAGAAEQPAPPRPGYVVSSMTLRRKGWEKIGPFDTDPAIPEFATWFLRARQVEANMALIPEVVARRRLHRGNKGRTMPEIQREYVVALKRHLDRRRAAATSSVGGSGTCR